jgi:hypothetical protein
MPAQLRLPLMRPRNLLLHMHLWFLATPIPPTAATTCHLLSSLSLRLAPSLLFCLHSVIPRMM